MPTVPEMIAAIRVTQMTIPDIAQALAVSVPAVYSWERGSVTPRAASLAKIRELYESIVLRGSSLPPPPIIPQQSDGNNLDGIDPDGNHLDEASAAPPTAPSPPVVRHRPAARIAAAAKATPLPERLAVAPPRQPGEAFRFIHCADLHLDSPLKGLEKVDDPRAPWIQTATRRAFSRLVKMAIEDRVHFVVIAGDLYDGDWQGMDTGYFMRRELARLAENGIHVYAIAGNHDALSIISRSFQWPQGTHQFVDAADSKDVPGLPVVIHGRSFGDRYVGRDFVESYPTARTGMFNVGLLHTSLSGTTGHVEYAPCSPQQLAARNYDYWALGHVHVRQIVQTNPHIVYSGNIQGRGIDEVGVKGCYVVTVDASHQPQPHFVPLDDIRWEHITIEVEPNGAGGIDAVVGSVIDTLERRLPDDDALLACRIALTGQTSLHRRLFSQRGSIRADIADAIDGQLQNRVWLEKIKIETMDPATAPAPPPDVPGRAIEFLEQEFQKLKTTPVADLLEEHADLRTLLDYLQPLEQVVRGSRDALQTPEAWQAAVAEAQAILSAQLAPDGAQPEAAP